MKPFSKTYNNCDDSSANGSHPMGANQISDSCRDSLIRLCRPRNRLSLGESNAVVCQEFPSWVVLQHYNTYHNNTINI